MQGTGQEQCLVARTLKTDRSENFKLLCLWEGEGTASGASAAYKDTRLPLAACWNGSFWVERSPVPTVCRLLFLMDRDRKPDADFFIEQVKAIFAHQGTPEVVVSDNGPQFNSRVFISFSENYGFTHLTSSPLHPLGNDEAEHAVLMMKKPLKKVDNPYIALLNYRAKPLQILCSPSFTSRKVSKAVSIQT